MARTPSRLPDYWPDRLYHRDDDETFTWGTGNDVSTSFNGTYWKVASSAQELLTKLEAGVSSLYGGATGGDDLKLYANSSDTYPSIFLLGADDARFDVGSGKDHLFYHNNVLACTIAAARTTFTTPVQGTRIEVDGTTHYIDASGNDLTFTDVTTGTKTLAQLAAGGGGSTDGSIFLTPAGAEVPDTNPAEKFRVNGTNFAYNELRFDDTTAEMAYWSFVTPKNWDAASDATVKIWWKAAATAGAVVFDCEFLDVADSAAYDAALTNAACAAVTVDGTAEHTNISTCTLTTPYTDNNMAVLEIHREPTDGSDTMSGDAKVIGVQIQYTSD